MKTVINIKTDKVLKIKVQKVAKEMGLPLGTLVNNYLRNLIIEKRAIFSVPEIPNKKTAELLKRASKDYRAGRNIVGPFSTGEEMDKYLSS